MPHSTKRYIICTTPRSGSNVVCDMLSQAGVLGWPAELLNPDAVRASRAFIEALPDQSVVSSAAYIEWLLKTRTAKTGVFGLKILFEDFENWRYTAAFRDLFMESKIILLRRRSKIRQAISYYFAEMTGQWIHSDPARMAVEDVPFDYERIHHHLTRLVRQDALWEVHLEGMALDYQLLIFEDFLRAPQSFIAQLAAELGVAVPDMDLSPRLKTQSGPRSKEFADRFCRSFAAAWKQDKERVWYKGLNITQ